jgi:hypothetical protein
VETQTEDEEEEGVHPLFEEVRLARTTTQVQVMKKPTISNESWSTAAITKIQVTPMTIPIAMQQHSLPAEEARPLNERWP